MTVSTPGLTSRTISSVTSEPAASSKKGKRASSTDMWVGNYVSCSTSQLIVFLEAYMRCILLVYK